MVMVKFIFLLAGPEATMKTMEDRLFADLAANFANAALRVNPIVDRGFSVDRIVSAGGQVIDAVLELWLPQATRDAVAQRILSESPDIGIVGAFGVDELILKKPDQLPAYVSGSQVAASDAAVGHRGLRASSW
jgi:hypothetical protein